MANSKPVDLNSLLLGAAEQVRLRTKVPDIRKYKPHTKQLKFHSSIKKRKLYLGGNRSGKTVGGVVEGIWRAVGRHPYRPELNKLVPTRGRVVGVDLTHGIDQIIIPIYKQWCVSTDLRGGSWESAYDKSARVLNFANGSTIEFLSYDQDTDKHAGTSRHWIHFDEEPPKNIYGEGLARLVDTNGDFWVTMTPVEGMTWVYDDLYEQNVDNPDGKVEVLEINTFENPYLTQEGIENLIGGIDADEAATRVGGKFIQVGGRVYKNFDETPGSLQVLAEPITDPYKMFPASHWLWMMGLDHGLNNPTAVVWVAFDRNGFAVQFDEYYHAERTIDQNARAIKDMCREHGRMPDILVADPSIINRNAVNGLSIQEEYQKYGLSFMLGNNDVKAGIVRVRKYFNEFDYVSTPLNRPVIFGGPEPGTNIREFKLDPKDSRFCRYRISPHCVNTRWELKRYRWKTYANKKLAFERNAYEEPNKKDDHLCDAIRYVIMQQPDPTAGDPEKSQLDVYMDQLDANMNAWGRPMMYDDPNDLNQDPTFDPFLDAARDVVDSGWQYDEHLGNMM